MSSDLIPMPLSLTTVHENSSFYRCRSSGWSRWYQSIGFSAHSAAVLPAKIVGKAHRPGRVAFNGMNAAITSAKGSFKSRWTSVGEKGCILHTENAQPTMR
jgi:hypothetical protein